VRVGERKKKKGGSRLPPVTSEDYDKRWKKKKTPALVVKKKRNLRGLSRVGRVAWWSGIKCKREEKREKKELRTWGNLRGTGSPRTHSSRKTQGGRKVSGKEKKGLWKEKTFENLCAEERVRSTGGNQLAHPGQKNYSAWRRNRAPTGG